MLLVIIYALIFRLVLQNIASKKFSKTKMMLREVLIIY
jgi:hypothetical protein